jgi:hypothetical protein
VVVQLELVEGRPTVTEILEVDPDSVDCERSRQIGSADRLREPARRQDRELTPQLAALDQSDFERLSATEVALVRSMVSTVADCSRKKSLPASSGSASGRWAPVSSARSRCHWPRTAPARSVPRHRIAQRRRERGPALASAVHDLGTEAFDKLGAPGTGPGAAVLRNRRGAPVDTSGVGAGRGGRGFSGRCPTPFTRRPRCDHDHQSRLESKPADWAPVSGTARILHPHALILTTPVG